MVIACHIFKRLRDGGQCLPINELQFLSKTFSAGVSIFFVLSGFLLSYPFWKSYLDNGKMPSMRLYTIRRAARIIPGYYVSLIFCFSASIFLLPDAVSPVVRFISGLTFTSAFNWLTMFPSEFNGPLWSIGFEVICYVLLPFSMYGLFKLHGKRSFLRAVIYWSLIFILVMIMNNFIQHFGQTDPINKGWDYGLTGGAKFWWPHYNPIGFFGQYIFGVFAAGFTLYIGKKNSRSSWYFDLIAFCSTILLATILWQMRHKDPFAFSFQSQPYYFPLFPLGAAILLCTLPHSKFLYRIFDNRFFRLTALLSFGLYIWHNVVLEFIHILLFPQYYHGSMTNVYAWASISFLALLISYFMAALSWKFVESPILNWAHGKVEIIKSRRLRAEFKDSKKIQIASHIIE